MRDHDRLKFVQLANKRVNNAIKAIQLVGNLSNKSNYDYTDEDSSKILRVLQEELNACKKRFETAPKTRVEPKFVLE